MGSHCRLSKPTEAISSSNWCTECGMMPNPSRLDGWTPTRDGSMTWDCSRPCFDNKASTFCIPWTIPLFWASCTASVSSFFTLSSNGIATASRPGIKSSVFEHLRKKQRDACPCCVNLGRSWNPATDEKTNVNRVPPPPFGGFGGGPLQIYVPYFNFKDSASWIPQDHP